MKFKSYILALHAALFAILLAVSPAGSGSMTLLGVGRVASVAPSYVGPGDVKSGAFAFYSCARGYNAAYAAAGGKACNICDQANVNCADVFVGANGKVTIPSVIGVTNCNLVSTCTIKTWYDQSGGNKCTGAPCDQTNSVNPAARATLTPSDLGGLPCGTAVAAAAIYTVTGFAGMSQPLSVSSVVKNTSGSSLSFFGDGGNDGFGLTGTNWGFFSSTNVSDGAVDTSFHALQMNDQGATSSIYLDGIGTTGLNAGTANFNTTINFFHDSFGNNWVGDVCEVGLYPFFSSGDSTSMNTNQHSSTNGYNF